jgi:hypothetical protein
VNQEEEKQDRDLTQQQELTKKSRQRTETLTRWPELLKKNSQHGNLLHERNEEKAAQPGALIQELITRRQNLAGTKDGRAGLNTDLKMALAHCS